MPGCNLTHCATVWLPASRFMVAGSYTRHSQLFSKNNLWNEKAAKEPKSSQTIIVEPSGSQKRQISGFWLQKSQTGSPDYSAGLRSTSARTESNACTNFILFVTCGLHMCDRLNSLWCDSATREL